jgi:hypothetical protein
VDQKEYRSMISSLLYLIAARLDIQFFVCLRTRFQAPPRTSHRQIIKRIFNYLRYTPELSFGTWRPLLFHFLVFRMSTLQGVVPIGNRLQVLARFWDLRLFLGLLSNNLV